MAKRRIWILSLGVFAIAGSSAWFLLRPKPLIEWADIAPPMDYEFPSAFNRKPVIDWKSPLGHLTLPKPRRILGDSLNPDVISGLLEGRDRGSKLLHTASLRQGSHTIALPVFTEQRSPSTSPPPLNYWSSEMVSWKGEQAILTYSSALPADRHYIGLPYATEEQFRDVTLEIDGKSYHAKLPLSSKFKSSQEPVVVKHDGISLTFKVAEWRFTTQDPKIAISADVHAGQAVLVTNLLGGQLLLPGKPAQMADVFDGGLYGKAILLAESRIKLKVKQPDQTSWEFWTMDGNLAATADNIWMGNTKPFIGIWSSGRWIAVQGGLAVGNGPMVTKDNWDLLSLKDGQVIDAIVYKKLDSWKLDVRFNLPPASPYPLDYPSPPRRFVS